MQHNTQTRRHIQLIGHFVSNLIKQNESKLHPLDFFLLILSRRISFGIVWHKNVGIGR